MRFLDLSALKLVGKRKGDKQLRYICPFCKERRGTPDTKGHLFVDLNQGIYHCFRCDASPKKTNLYIYSSIYKRVFEQPKFISETSTTIFLPNDYCYLKESTENFFPIFEEYVKERGITKDDEYKYNMGFTIDLNNPFFGRLIFCYFDEVAKEDWDLVFYQGRWVLESENPCKYLSCGDKPLFKSFRGQVKKGMIVEGFFDMVKSSRFIPSAAILGHNITEKQGISITKSFSEKVILALDSDVPGDIIHCVKQIKGPEVIPIFLPRKDIDEMDDNEVERLIRKVI